MEGEQFRQKSRRRFIRVSGWILFSLGLVGATVFWWSALNSETTVRMVSRVERQKITSRGMRVADEAAFQTAIGDMEERFAISNCIMGTVGLAMVFCGLLLGLFRATMPASISLLAVYAICTIIMFIVLGKAVTPIVILWRLGMIYFLSHILYTVICFASALRKLTLEYELE